MDPYRECCYLLDYNALKKLVVLVCDIGLKRADRIKTDRSINE